MIPPATISQSLRHSAGFSGGPTYEILCQAIGNALVTWLPTVTLTGVTTGVIGAGTVTGTLTFTGLLPAVLAALTGAGLQGQAVQGLATGLVNGLTVLNGLTYLGNSTGVATGTDTTFVTVANTTSLASILQGVHTSLCSAQGGTGSSVPGFYTGIANAIGTIVSTGIGTGVVAPAGPVGPSSSAGTSLSHPV